MDSQKIYELGKEFYYDNRYEDDFEDMYAEMDDLLDNLDNLRMEIKILIEEKNKNEMSPEEKLQELYKKLSLISKDIDEYDSSDADVIIKEMEKFKAKNKYRFLQLEDLEKKYALAVKKGESKKSLNMINENLKKMRLNTLGIRNKLKKYQSQVDEAKGDLLTLEAKKESILKEISKTQKNLRKNSKEDDVKTVQAINEKKNNLDNVKKKIKKVFFKIGKDAIKKGLN